MHLVQIELVQSSFAHVEPIADTAAALFYSRLFELDPSLRLMFKGNIVEQGEKLMTTLKVVVSCCMNLRLSFQAAVRLPQGCVSSLGIHTRMLVAPRLAHA